MSGSTLPDGHIDKNKPQLDSLGRIELEEGDPGVKGCVRKVALEGVSRRWGFFGRIGLKDVCAVP